MVQYSRHSSLSVLYWKFDVYLAFTRLRVVSYTSWSDLAFLKVNTDPLANAQLICILSDELIHLIFF